jgi:hypothetical protein
MHAAEAAGKFHYIPPGVSIDDEVGVATAQEDFLQPTPGTDSYHLNGSFGLYQYVPCCKFTQTSDIGYHI